MFLFIKTKSKEYNHKFSSMFTLLSAITDEITKLKIQINGGVPGSYQTKKKIKMKL